MDINELKSKLRTDLPIKNLPFTILEEMCIVRGTIEIKNLPENLAINLINLKETYPDSFKILFKEKSMEDCTNYEKYPKFTQNIIPKTNDLIELK